MLGSLLERLKIIERSRFRETVNLAWPRIVTGFARMSQQTVDLAMVGLAIGPAAIAGLAFSYAIWQIGNKISLGLSGGTISLVSQHFGGDRNELADQIINQSYLLATVIAIPLAILFFTIPDIMIGAMGAAPETVYYGAIYMSILAPAIVFEFYNKIASRIFAGIGDTLTPMVIRGAGAIVNIILNGVFIFGLGWGVAGAALGTLIATVLVSVVFLWGLLFRKYPVRETIPVGFARSEAGIEIDLIRPLVRISTPLVLQELSRAIVMFPLLAIAAMFGPVGVAAFEIGRRIRDLINSLSWGFTIASSSLVGRHLGANEESIAEAYGDEIIRLSVVSFALVAIIIIAVSESLARLFTSDPATIAATIPFIQIGALASIGLAIDKGATGALRGAGDTKWPFYSALIGLYVFTLPIAYLGVITPLGIQALYLALLVETFVPAVIVMYRYRTGIWLEISRSIRENTS